ncbi:MAG: hypothetical protein JSW73_02475 [Candidatus Woesearchaeota archaeon]|nr:MAG: hypothetical protein JSW73_02475 [Candidatus Woesearchaeota archaeon]
MKKNSNFKKYGEQYIWSKNGDYFFNEKTGEITVIRPNSDKIETYNLNEIKEKAKAIFKKHGIVPEIKVPEGLYNKAIAAGIDSNDIKSFSLEDVVHWLDITRPYSLRDKLSKEEFEIVNLIPPWKRGDVYVPNLTPEKKLELYIGFVFRIMSKTHK